jgi:hypothetical protein
MTGLSQRESEGGEAVNDDIVAEKPKHQEHLTLMFKWTVSRARDTYGYNVCTLYVDGKKVAQCDGGGYDMEGTVLGLWVAKRFPDQLREKITTSFYGLTFHDPDFDAAKAIVPDTGQTVEAMEAAGKSLGLERYQAAFSASSPIPTRTHRVPYLDGACGMECMIQVLKAIGGEYKVIESRKNYLIASVSVPRIVQEAKHDEGNRTKEWQAVEEQGARAHERNEHVPEQQAKAEAPTSFAVQLKEKGKAEWMGDAVRLPDRDQAARYSLSLLSLQTEAARVVESADPANHVFVGVRLAKMASTAAAEQKPEGKLHPLNPTVSEKVDNPTGEVRGDQPEKRMKLSEAAKRAVDTQDAVMLGRVVEQLRFKLGYDYQRCYEFAHKNSGIEAHQFDEMLYEFDTRQGETADAQKTTQTHRRKLGDQPTVNRDQTPSQPCAGDNHGIKKEKTAAPEPANNHKEDFTVSEKEKPDNANGGKLLAKLACGHIRGSVWLNQSEEGDYLSASFARVYKAPDGAMKATHSYRLEHLSELSEVALGAKKLIQEESLKLGLKQLPETRRVRITR